MLKLKHIFLLSSPILLILIGLFFISNLIKNNFNYKSDDKYKLINNFSYEIKYSQDKIMSKLSQKFNIKDEK